MWYTMAVGGLLPPAAFEDAGAVPAAVNMEGKRVERVLEWLRNPIVKRVLLVLYIILMVIAVIIVGVYCFLQFGVKPPDVENPTPPPTPPAVTTPSGPDVTGTPGPGDGPDPTTTPDPTPARREEVYTCLIFGLDHFSGSTDTIMVATFDVPNQKIGLVSIPRDTVVRRDRGAASNKINAAYAAGGSGSSGVEQLKREVQELLGIPIDFYVKIRLSAFEKLVNAVDGVWFDVPRNMDYDDDDQNLHIHLQKGYQLLNGEQAMGLVRFRQDNNGNDSFGDVGRAGVQQDFLKAMLKQVISGASVSSLPALIDVVLNQVETNADLNACLYFGKALLDMDLDGKLETETLPSTWRYPYMWVEKAQALDTINRLLNPMTYDVTIDMVEFFDE